MSRRPPLNSQNSCGVIYQEETRPLSKVVVSSVSLDAYFAHIPLATSMWGLLVFSHWTHRSANMGSSCKQAGSVAVCCLKWKQPPMHAFSSSCGARHGKKHCGRERLIGCTCAAWVRYRPASEPAPNIISCCECRRGR